MDDYCAHREMQADRRRLLACVQYIERSHLLELPSDEPRRKRCRDDEWTFRLTNQAETYRTNVYHCVGQYLRGSADCRCDPDRTRMIVATNLQALLFPGKSFDSADAFERCLTTYVDSFAVMLRGTTADARLYRTWFNSFLSDLSSRGDSPSSALLAIDDRAADVAANGDLHESVFSLLCYIHSLLNGTESVAHRTFYRLYLEAVCHTYATNVHVYDVRSIALAAAAATAAGERSKVSPCETYRCVRGTDDIVRSHLYLLKNGDSGEFYLLDPILVSDCYAALQRSPPPQDETLRAHTSLKRQATVRYETHFVSGVPELNAGDHVRCCVNGRRLTWAGEMRRSRIAETFHEYEFAVRALLENSSSIFAPGRLVSFAVKLPVSAKRAKVSRWKDTESQLIAQYVRRSAKDRLTIEWRMVVAGDGTRAIATMDREDLFRIKIYS